MDLNEISKEIQHEDNNILIDLLDMKDGEQVLCSVDELPKWRSILAKSQSPMGLVLEDGKVTIRNKKAFVLQKKKDKMTYKAIGELLGITKQRAEAIARNTGPLQSTKWSDYSGEWKDMYNNMQMSIPEIAKRYNAGITTVRHQLQKAGVKFRPAGRPDKNLEKS